jgi:dinuclear metal center YbgI/SA1388 family protein
MNADRADIVAYLNEYLRVADFPDYGPQGLQVEGTPLVSRVVTGVSACLELFEAAVHNEAQMVLVHHGLIWDRDPRVVKGAFRRRLDALLRHELNLAAYHLCLDAHPEVGNNALAVRALGLTQPAPWGPDKPPIGWQGVWAPACDSREALRRIALVYGGDPIAFMEGGNEIKRVAVVSGGAQRMLFDAIDDGVDLFVTGEVSEFVMHAAREGGIHFAAAGHHNTERLGIRALGEHVAERFGIEHVFIDTPNPI